MTIERKIIIICDGKDCGASDEEDWEHADDEQIPIDNWILCGWTIFEEEGAFCYDCTHGGEDE